MTNASAVVQFLFDLEIDAKTASDKVKTIVESLRQMDLTLKKVTSDGEKNVNKLNDAFKRTGEVAKNVFRGMMNLKNLLLSGWLFSTILAAYNWNRELAKMGEVSDITGNKLAKFDRTLGSIYSRFDFTEDQIRTAMGTIQNYANVTDAAFERTTLSILNFNRYTGISIEQATEISNRYGVVMGIYKSTADAADGLGKVMVDVSRTYGISSTEMMSALQSVEITLVRLGTTARQQAIPSFLKVVGAFNEIGISATTTGEIMNNIGEITSTTGHRMRMAIMAFGKAGPDIMNAFQNPLEKGNPEKIAKGLFNAVQSPQVRAMMKVSMAKTAEMLGMDPNTLAKLANVKDLNTFQNILNKGKVEQNKIEEIKKKREALEVNFIEIISHLIKLIQVRFGNQLMPLLMKAVPILINILVHVLKFITWLPMLWQIFKIIAGIATVIVLAAFLLSNPAGWLTALASGIMAVFGSLPFWAQLIAIIAGVLGILDFFKTLFSGAGKFFGLFKGGKENPKDKKTKKLDANPPKEGKEPSTLVKEEKVPNANIKLEPEVKIPKGADVNTQILAYLKDISQTNRDMMRQGGNPSRLTAYN